MTPLRFAFAIHLHQPIGNFDFVFQEHLDGVYRPLLNRVRERGFLPITLHLSGPLLDWLDANDRAFVDAIGRDVADGRIELLGSGRYEPVLAALGRRDRMAQVAGMRERLRERFGCDADGLWLTERVWEPDLASDLRRAGVRYTLLDDRHFLTAGLPAGALDRPYLAEHDGEALTLLSIDERLRYLIPFRPPREIEDYFRARIAEGLSLVVLGDDGEKFGGWPDTREWVYESGWLDGFLDLVERLGETGEIELITTGAAASLPAGGSAYPSPGSYREMEEWTLPRPAALDLERLRDPGGGGDAAPALVRGGHWKLFLTRYAEAARMHRTALALSRLCRERGDPARAREHIARAQCNDAYWHGVFGGIYLPHLRRGVWAELARAESLLRRDEPFGWSELDWDLDGWPELWLHAPGASAIVSPARGGTVEVYLDHAGAANLADVFSLYLEPYHAGPGEDAAPADPPRIPADPDADSRQEDEPAVEIGAGPGVASIHDREGAKPAPPGVDPRPRALFQDRTVGAAGETLGDWAGLRWTLDAPPAETPDGIEVRLRPGGEAGVRKRIVLGRDGRLRVDLAWEPAALSGAAAVETALSVAHAPGVLADDAATVTREPLVTLARSERGFERVVQGEAVTIRWPAAAGAGRVTISPRPAPGDGTFPAEEAGPAGPV